MNLKQVEKLLSKSSMMPIEDRRVLVDGIQKSIDEFKKRWSAEQRYSILVPMAESCLKAKLNNTRERRCVLIRVFIAYKMRLEGYTLREIGRVLNRHHATVIVYVQMMKDMNDVPRFYANELQRYKEFEEAVKEYDKDNPIV